MPLRWIVLRHLQHELLHGGGGLLVGGLPGFRSALWCHLRATSWRCQTNSVGGPTGNTSFRAPQVFGRVGTPDAYSDVLSHVRVKPRLPNGLPEMICADTARPCRLPFPAGSSV